MDFKKVVEILKYEGHKKEIMYNDSEMKEIEPFPGGEHYFLIKEGLNWRLGYVSMERTPKEVTIAVYSSLEDGASSFLLNRLSSHYLHKYITKAKNDSKIIDLLIANKLILNDLINALNKYNIPVSYLSTQKNNNHSIKLLEENGRWMSEYLDKDGSNHKRTIPESLPECISYAFARIMYLYLLDNVTIKYLDGKKSYEYFTAEEIAVYVS